ncbi:putative ATP-dependent RNA helicase dhr2 [Ascosphaera pollenicola]|nr:putative ATP-dependent RNA helicase dhr2 [Ascosphaera pollenicola]
MANEEVKADGKPVYKNMILAGPKKSSKKRKRDVAKGDAASSTKKSHKQALPTPERGNADDEREEGVKTGRDEKKRKQKRVKNDDASDESTALKPPVAGSLKAKAEALAQTRQGLPIFPYADEIREDLKKTDVMLLVGETGSGKSTQIPQFLVDEKWCRPVKAQVPRSDKGQKDEQEDDSKDSNASAEKSQGKKKKNKKGAAQTTIEKSIGGCIAITQPRRVAAISLARRVADEVGTPLGSSSPASQVGYSVRFDTSVSPSTRIKYLTEGMLLQEMLGDPWLTKYSAVVVDEVHERGVNVDVILGFLRNIVSDPVKQGRGGVPLKVVVMSATADMESLTDFFSKGLRKKAIEDEKPETDPTSKEQTNPTSTELSVCHVKGRQYPVKTIYTPHPVSDFVDAALKTIFQIHMKEPLPGDILVFLTGQETVEALEALVNEYAAGIDRALPKVQVLPLFAALPQAAQQRVFQPAPPRTRKVILATNIAETSVTVSGVRHVVDCGKAKMKQFRTRLGLDSLLVKPISKSAAIQRKGRAGREAPGTCYRLYTEKDYLALADTNTPEILRCDLSQALLTLKARGVDDVINFPFLTRPPREALEKALLQLFNLHALDGNGRISRIGRQIAQLPLNAPLGRVLLAAAEHGHSVLLDVVDILSCLSVENIFLGTASEEKREEAEIARRDLYRREGDHLTMLATVRGYAADNVDRKAWAEKHLVSHRAMQSVMDVRKQLLAQCRQAKLLPQEEIYNDYDTSLNAVPILQSFLAGFATNTARLQPDGSYRSVVGNQTVAIHPSSILFGRKVEAIMYNEFVFTNRSYARGVSAVQMDWVGKALGVM